LLFPVWGSRCGPASCLLSRGSRRSRTGGNARLEGRRDLADRSRSRSPPRRAGLCGARGESETNRPTGGPETLMRVLITIPHYFGAPPESRGAKHGSQGKDAEPRKRALAACLQALVDLFGRPQCLIDIARRTTTPANRATTL